MTDTTLRDTSRGFIPKPNARIAFEECADSGCWDLWFNTEGHHEDSPLLRKRLLRALALNQNPGEGLAAQARNAKIIRGYEGEVPGTYDRVQVEEDGTPTMVHEDDDGNEVTRATAWWPCTWAVIPDGQ